MPALPLAQVSHRQSSAPTVQKGVNVIQALYSMDKRVLKRLSVAATTMEELTR